MAELTHRGRGYVKLFFVSPGLPLRGIIKISSSMHMSINLYLTTKTSLLLSILIQDCLSFLEHSCRILNRSLKIRQSYLGFWCLRVFGTKRLADHPCRPQILNFVAFYRGVSRQIGVTMVDPERSYKQPKGCRYILYG